MNRTAGLLPYREPSAPYQWGRTREDRFSCATHQYQQAHCFAKKIQVFFIIILHLPQHGFVPDGIK